MSAKRKGNRTMAKMRKSDQSYCDQHFSAATVAESQKKSMIETMVLDCLWRETADNTPEHERTTPLAYVYGLLANTDVNDFWRLYQEARRGVPFDDTEMFRVAFSPSNPKIIALARDVYAMGAAQA